MGQNKKQRTADLKERSKKMMIKEMVQNYIEESNFKRLVMSGLIFVIRTERELKKVLV